MTISQKEKEKKQPRSIFIAIMAIVSIVVLGLNKIGPLAGKLSDVGFTLFIILCLGMIVVSRRSIGKIIIVVLYFLFGLYMFLK